MKATEQQTKTKQTDPVSSSSFKQSTTTKHQPAAQTNKQSWAPASNPSAKRIQIIEDSTSESETSPRAGTDSKPPVVDTNQQRKSQSKSARNKKRKQAKKSAAAAAAKSQQSHQQEATTSVPTLSTKYVW